MIFYIGVISNDHEGDDFEEAVICATIEEAKARIRDDYGDSQNIYRCEIGKPPKSVAWRHKVYKAPKFEEEWEDWKNG